MKRILTLALATVTQLVRMKILVFVLLFCLIIVGAGFAFSVINPEQQLSLIKTVSLGALQIFSLVIAIVATALLLPKDMEDRTLYTILAKPVPRWHYLTGKLLGVLLLIGGGLLLMDALLSAVIWMRQGMVLREAEFTLNLARGGASPETLEQLHTAVARQGLTWQLHWAVYAIFLKAAVVTAMALLLSCLASSTLFTTGVAFCAVIIGHGEHLLREFFFHPHLSGIGERMASLALAVLVPDLAQFDIIDGVVNGETVSLSAISDLTLMAMLYLIGYTTIAHLTFVEKEL
jgi:hypothetical protein